MWLSDALLLIPYMVLIVLVSSPQEEWRQARFESMSAAAFLCALLSALALPWGGVPFSHYAGVGSWIWLPAVGLSSLLLVGDGAGGSFRLVKAVVIICLAAFVSTANWFILRQGVPGGFFSIEAASMILRVGSAWGAVPKAAMVLFFIGHVLSFAPLCSIRGVSAGVLALSYSGFLVITFVPFSPAGLLGLYPPISMAADAAVMFAASVLLARFFLYCLGPMLASYIGTNRRRAMLPAIFMAAGCCLILAVS
ncbi:MAG: hypothetical protein LBT08_02695 [Synergistaceae bacterium]|nr:hypothetical protein [Synergistaceae bacterium]